MITSKSLSSVNARYFRIKLLIVLRLVGGANVQYITQIHMSRLKGICQTLHHSKMATRSLRKALADSGSAASIPSLVSSADLDTLLERLRTRSLRAKGNSAVVKDLVKIWQWWGSTPFATPLMIFGRKTSKPAALSNITPSISPQPRVHSSRCLLMWFHWSGQYRIGYAIYISDCENITKTGIEFSGQLIFIGHQVSIRRETLDLEKHAIYVCWHNQKIL